MIKRIQKKFLLISCHTFCNDFTPFKRNISVAYFSFPQKRISVKKSIFYFSLFSPIGQFLAFIAVQIWLHVASSLN